MDFGPFYSVPALMLVHLMTRNNIHVADIWESKEDLNRFLNERLIPVMQQSKLTLPKTEIFEIHNVNAYSGLERYKI